MPVELDDKKKNQKEIYNDSVRLLELLNVLIPKIGTFEGKVKIEILQEISDKCFTLGANICTSIEDINTKEEALEDDCDSYYSGM